MKWAKTVHPLGHIGETNDIAFGILCLTSDESKSVPGNEMGIEGSHISITISGLHKFSYH